LKRAAALDRPGTGFHGEFDLGFQVSPDLIRGQMEAIGHLDTGKLDLSIYAAAWAGFQNTDVGWSNDWGAEIGLKGRF
jgi:hypothetical protein